MPTTQWFLTSRERGNPSTRLDTRHRGDMAWTEGNLVRPLIHGATYFAELHHRVSQMHDGDLLMFVDWRGDPDERLTGSQDSEVGQVFADAARRGVDVRGLVWRSHWDRLAFSAAVAGLLRRSPDGAVCRSSYGHRGLAPMRPVIVRRLGRLVAGDGRQAGAARSTVS